MAFRDLFRKGLNSDAINQGLWSVQVGVQDAAYPPGLSLYEGYAKDYLTMYRSQPAVRFVVDFIARNVAQVPLKAFRRLGDNDRQSLPDHPFAAFIARANREDTRYTFLRDLVTDLCIWDCAIRPKNRSGDLLSVQRWSPDAVSFVGGDNLAPKTFRLTNPDGTTVDKDRSDVFWMHGYGSRRGVPPMETLRRILAEDDAAGRHREGSYRNGMRQAGVITRPLEAPPWDDATRKAFRDNLTSRYSGGANAGKPLILEEGMQWQGDQVDTKDSEYIASRTFTMKAVALAFHVSPQMLGIEGAPYASVSAYHNYLYQDTLAPLLEFLTEGIERQILPEFDTDPQVYVEFALEAKLRGSFEEQAGIITAAVGGPWMTIDEARSLRNLPPLPDDLGTEIITPLNVMRGGGPQPEPGTPTDGTTPTVPAAAAASGDFAPEDISKLVAAATGLIRAGFEPEAALTAVGLGHIPHTGLVPVTVRDDNAAPVGPPKAQDIAEAFRKASKAGPPRGVVKRRDGYAAEIEMTLTAFLARQQRQVKALRPDRGKAHLMGIERWRRELEKDLRPLFDKVTVAEGKRKAAQLGGDYDAGQTVHYLDAGASNMAKNINDAVVEALAKHEDVEYVFDVVMAALAARVAIGQATHLQAFAREEAGKQNGAVMKTWIVTSGKSRHPEMDGATAPVGKTFSNGLMWPGDPAGSAADTAGCQCVLDIGTAAKSVPPRSTRTGPVSVDLFPEIVVKAPDVHVEAPQVHVKPPEVYVRPPEVTVQAPEVTVNLESPPPTPPRKTRKTVKRDSHNRITSIEEEEV